MKRRIMINGYVINWMLRKSVSKFFKSVVGPDQKLGKNIIAFSSYKPM